MVASLSDHQRLQTIGEGAAGRGQAFQVRLLVLLDGVDGPRRKFLFCLMEVYSNCNDECNRMQCPRGLGSVPPILLFLPPTLASMCRATAVDIVACTVQFGVSQASVLRQPSCYSTVQYSTYWYS